jgi:homogentisate 1,2-dioxygenase
MPYPSPTDPTALQVPAFHDNVEYDEVLFLHDGKPTALTEGFEPGLMTLDPRGLTHGPLPTMQSYFHKPAESMDNNFVVLMFDTRDPLELGKDAHRYEIPGAQWLPTEGVKNAPDAGKHFHPLRLMAKVGAILKYLMFQLSFKIKKSVY